MAWLRIETPDGETRHVELGREALRLGRGADMDVALADPKVSARHLQLRPLGDGETWIARDLGSTRGTSRDGRRLLRAEVRLGDRLEVGATQLVLTDVPPPDAPSPIVASTLDLRPVEVAPPPPASPAETAVPAAGPSPDREVEAPLDRRAVRVAVLWLLAGVLAVAGVVLTIGPRVGAAEAEARARRDVRDVLAVADLGLEAFEAEVDDFIARYPDRPEGEELQALLASAREREAARVALQHRLLGLAEDLYGLPDSEVRGELLALAATLPDDADLVRQIDSALDALDRRHGAAEASALDRIGAAVDRRIAAGDPAGALRQLTAFRATWPAPGVETLRRLRRIEDRTLAALDTLADDAVAQAEATTDPGEVRRILGRAWRGLEGTPQAQRIAELLRYTRGPGRAGPDLPDPADPTAPTDEPEPQILLDAARAEALASERRWREALAAFEKLVGQAEEGLLKREWETRVREMAYVLSLVGLLTDGAADGGHRVELPSGAVRVVRVSDDGVAFERDGVEERMAWASMESDELLAFLEPKRPEPQHRLGLAVLAATLGDRARFEAVLLPLFEEGTASAEANAMVARYLHGRSKPPEGGYRAHRGRLLDPTTYREVLAQEEAARLTAEAREILARIKKDPSLKKLDRMRALRAQLDERRRHALLAIFNEKHYPYPANKASSQYQAVQREIDRRVALVRETWDDPFKFELRREGRLQRPLEAWDEALARIRQLGGDTRALEAEIAPIASYVDQGVITVRSFWLHDVERKLFAYNDWVMDVYNPSRTEEATEAERDQTRVTNDYRRMLGYMVAVMPGPASFEAIDDDSVARILDAGRIQGAPAPLHAVRVDDRLVRAARDHSVDMANRGFFSHHAPPNPQTGAPGTSPFDRMQAAGYAGRGMSENIVMGASNAEEAHDRWCHSSGHHRNILSLWTDQGVGRSGRYWTQNYGTGGGAPPVIPGADDPGAATPGSARDRAR